MTDPPKINLSKADIGGETVDRRTRRGAETRERLFVAAVQLFAQKGFAETTVEDITNAADVGKGTFFNYFPSKEHILIAFSDMQLGKLERFVETARNGREPMRSFFRTMSEQMTSEPAKKPDVMRALLQANLSSSSVRNLMRERNARGENLLSQLVQIGQERGEFRRDVSALEIARVFRQLTFGTLLLWSVYGDESLAERLDRAIDIVWTGFSSREDVTSHAAKS
ncbi:MAG TPA: TetR/AcrR family transcriptional regulator [Candidatus Sulfotelmatobacter sp.]|nr:TetR/AcrR family transcriptional regulator [Candidatus Sulfotelmatobacter sp.]